MAFAHVFGPEKKNGLGPFSYKFFVCIRVGLTCEIIFFWETSGVEEIPMNFSLNTTYYVDKLQQRI